MWEIQAQRLEHRPTNLEVMGLNPLEYGAFSFPFSTFLCNIVLNKLPREGASLLMM